MEREDLIQLIFESDKLFTCPKPFECGKPEKENGTDCCRVCAEKLLADYEKTILQRK